MRKLFVVLVVAVTLFSCCRTEESVELNITYKDGTTATEVRPLEVKGCFFGEEYLRFEMSKEELATIADLKVLPSFGRANVGDEGYFVSTDGMLSTFKPLSKDARRVRTARFHPLALNGFKLKDKCYAAIMKGLQFECIQSVELVEDK